MQALSNIITATVNIKINRLNNELRQLLQATAQSTSFLFAAKLNNRHENTKFRFFKKRTSKKVEFFDFIAEKLELVVNFNKHIFYRDVYAFVDRLKDVANIRKKKQIKDCHFTMLTRYSFYMTFHEIVRYKKRNL